MAESLKGKFPFLLGTTSYIIPDDVLPNALYLSDKVDDIQILLFESDEISSYPAEETIFQLLKLKAESGISYSVHLPVDALLGSYDAAIRENSVSKILRAWKIMQPLEPFVYVLHFDYFQEEHTSLNIERWISALDTSMAEIIAAGMNPVDICIENLGYPFELVEKVVEKHNLSTCIDIGHLISYGANIREHFEKFFPRCRAFHLQGSEGELIIKTSPILIPNY